MNKFVLELINVKHSFKQGNETLSILTDVNLQINKAELVAMIGPSGSGKTTLLQIAGLLSDAKSGKVIIDGKEVKKNDDRLRTKLRSKYIGFVYQFHHLLQEFTALENVMMPQIIAGKNMKLAKQRAEYLLEEVHLKDRMNHTPSQLSGGEQQRVSIARALINKPKLLLADEPTGNLDVVRAEEIVELFINLAKKEEMAAIVVTHNNELAKKLNVIYEINKGKLIERK